MEKMKKHFALLIILGLGSIQYCFAKDKIAIISGNIVGYDSISGDDSFIYFDIVNVIRSTKIQTKISKNGTFHLYSPITETQEFIFMYNLRSLVLVVNPGDSIFLKINKKKFMDESNYASFILLSGHSIFPNTYILKYTAWLDSIKAQWASELKGTVSNGEFKSLRMTGLANCKSNLKALLNRDKINSDPFRNWMFAQLDYLTGTDLCFYPFNKICKDLADTSEYFNLTREIKLNNPEYKYSESYITFMYAYEASIEIMCNLNPLYQAENKKAILADTVSKSAFRLYLNLLSVKTEGIGREYLLAYLYNGFIKRHITLGSTNINLIKNNISDDLFSRINNLHLLKKVNIYDCINAFEVSEIVKDRIRDIFRNSMGHIIYIDLMADGCGPCLRELSHYDELTHATGKDVSYIFLGAYYEPAKWESTIKKFNIRGEKFLLDKTEFAFFYKYLDFRGFPHHSIIDKKGNIISNDPPRVGDNPVALEKYLKKLAAP